MAYRNHGDTCSRNRAAFVAILRDLLSFATKAFKKLVAARRRRYRVAGARQCVWSGRSLIRTAAVLLRSRLRLNPTPTTGLYARCTWRVLTCRASIFCLNSLSDDMYVFPLSTTQPFGSFGSSSCSGVINDTYAVVFIPAQIHFLVPCNIIAKLVSSVVLAFILQASLLPDNEDVTLFFVFFLLVVIE